MARLGQRDPKAAKPHLSRRFQALTGSNAAFLLA
jgi:hypothetical protein